MHLLYENAYSFYTSLVTEIKQMPEFEDGCKIALIGNSEQYITQFDEFDDITRIMGVTGLTVNTYSREKFIRYYIGFDPQFATEEEILTLVKNPDFLQLPSYPYYGSLSRIDNYIVVKFSDVDTKEKVGN